MPRTQFPIIGGFGQERNHVLGNERTINMYKVDYKTSHWPDTSKRSGLAKWPGYLKSLTFNDGSGGRGAFVNKVTATAEMYQVIEDHVYKLDASLTPTEISSGPLNTTTGPVRIDQNQTQVIFVDGADGYVYTPSSGTWTQIVDANFPANPIDVVAIDGYAIIPNGGTNEFRLSQNGAFQTWTALQSAFMTSRPDIIIGIATLNRQLFLFGKQSCEIWYDAGTSDFPFRRYSTALPAYGCAARASIAEGFGYIFFLAQDENGVSSVIIVRGIQFKPISTAAIEDQLELISDVSDAVGQLFKIDGNLFYQLSFTTGDRTFVYHVNKDEWYELQESDGSRHKMQYHVFFNNAHYFNAYNDGNLYKLSKDYLDNNGNLIKCERISTIMSHPSNNFIKLNEIRMTFAQGVGLDENDSDKDPEIFLSISRDEGITYGNRITKKIGRKGDYGYETIWDKGYGISRSYVFRIEYFNNTEYILTGMSIDYDIMEQ